MITGNGRHLWFQSAGPIPSTAGRIGAGLDTRGELGYVIGPPSVHPSGRAYAWSGESDRLAVAPGWLVDLARKKPQPKIAERVRQNIRPPNGRRLYGEAALDGEIGTLEAALAGTTKLGAEPRKLPSLRSLSPVASSIRMASEIA